MNKNELLKIKKAKNLSLSMEAIIELKRKADMLGKTESQFIEDYILTKQLVPPLNLSERSIEPLKPGAVHSIKRVEDNSQIKVDEDIDVAAVYAYYMTVFDKDLRYKLTKDRKNVIKARLDDGFSVEECRQHIDFISQSPYHNGENEQKTIYNDLKDIIFNKTKFDKRVDQIKAKPVKKELSDEDLEAQYEEKMKDLPF